MSFVPITGAAQSRSWIGNRHGPPTEGSALRPRAAERSRPIHRTSQLRARIGHRRGPTTEGSALRPLRPNSNVPFIGRHNHAPVLATATGRPRRDRRYNLDGPPVCRTGSPALDLYQMTRLALVFSARIPAIEGIRTCRAEVNG